MRAELMALVRVESTFEERAEDGGFHFFPVGVGCINEETELGTIEWKCLSRFEEAAVELENVRLEDGRKSTGVHGVPERLCHLGKDVDATRVAKVAQEIEPALFGKKLHVFGERGEDAAGEELCDVFGGMLLFQRSGEDGELCSDLTRDFGSMARGIEGVRVEPEKTKALANVGVGKVGEEDAIAASIREREVGFASEGEVGKKFDRVAHVYGDEKGRPTFGNGEGFGVALGLVIGLHHSFVPAMGPANGGSSATALGTH